MELAPLPTTEADVCAACHRYCLCCCVSTSAGNRRCRPTPCTPRSDRNRPPTAAEQVRSRYHDPTPRRRYNASTQFFTSGPGGRARHAPRTKTARPISTIWLHCLAERAPVLQMQSPTTSRTPNSIPNRVRSSRSLQLGTYPRGWGQWGRPPTPSPLGLSLISDVWWAFRRGTQTTPECWSQGSPRVGIGGHKSRGPQNLVSGDPRVGLLASTSFSRGNQQLVSGIPENIQLDKHFKSKHLINY